jgi:tetratricopeptide (TPR) repeat protein
VGDPGEEELSERRLLALALALLAAACATPQADRLLERPAVGRVELADVPFYPQERYQCGPASLAMVLDWGGLQVDPERLSEQAFTESRSGSFQHDIVSAALRHGHVPYRVSSLEGMLAELDARHPVLVFQNLGLSWIPRWHFAVAVGYDLERGSLLLHTGRSERRELGLRLFERTWARAAHWAIVVLPPARLPATAEELPFLRAVTGLERVDRPEQAAIAYETALARWPGSLAAWIGLGNSRYASGDRAGAAVAFREATRLHPDSAAAFHNLAEALADLGRDAEAAEAARRAAALGGAGHQSR